MLDGPAATAIGAIYEEAQRQGFLGPGDPHTHVSHALRFVRAWPPERFSPPAVIDLGSGGGVPGLVLASVWPDSHVVLLDGSQRRAAFLAEAIVHLGFGGRAEVDARRAEEAARDPRRREGFDLAVARSFGAPAVVAECGAPFLRTGGCLLVSEPPDGTGDRWLVGDEPLAHLGLRRQGPAREGVQVLDKVGTTPETFPRRTGVPTKRPLW